jgi:hypothetical protein
MMQQPSLQAMFAGHVSVHHFPRRGVMRPEQGFSRCGESLGREKDQLSVIMIIGPKQALGVHFHELWIVSGETGIRTRHGTTEQ